MHWSACAAAGQSSEDAFSSRFFKAVHDGNPGASWMAAASPILRWYAFPVVALSAVSKGLTGHGLPVRCHCGSTYHCIHMCQQGLPDAASSQAGGLQSQMAPAPFPWGGVKGMVVEFRTCVAHQDRHMTPLGRVVVLQILTYSVIPAGKLSGHH